MTGRVCRSFGSLACGQVKETCKRSFQAYRESARLLPLLPDDVTFTHVVTKLPWKTIYALSSVSVAWHGAVRSRRVHAARVLSDATNTHVIVSYDRSDNVYALAFYSLRDKSCLELPGIPNVVGGIPEYSQGVALDGKFYVMGGKRKCDDSSMDEVYVLDLAAGLGQWKPCASMIQARKSFGCGVMHGKIFVFGGTRCADDVRSFESEVYDPQQNRWSSITPMIRPIHGIRVEKLGSDFILQGAVSPHGMTSAELEEFRDVWSATETYTPITGKWQTMKSIWTDDSVGRLILARKEFCEVTSMYIDIHQAGEISWGLLHWLSLEAISPGASHFDAMPVVVEVVDDEIISIVHWLNGDGSLGSGVLQTVGLGGKNRNIEWQRTPCFTASANWDFEELLKYYICPVNL